MKLFLVLTSLMFMSLSVKAHEVVVLIPGFLTLLHPSISQKISSTRLQTKALKFTSPIN
ncbi:MAG: hypothetical protein H7256_14325 [Bdellovibrio sp.]|nr:hypothetical protein [Bdellovibrio sp.]